MNQRFIISTQDGPDSKLGRNWSMIQLAGGEDGESRMTAVFRTMRFVLSGVLVGVALAGLISQILGYPASFATEIVGGGVGFIGTIIALSKAHLLSFG